MIDPQGDKPAEQHVEFDPVIVAKSLAAVLSRPRVRRLLPSEHFSVDGHSAIWPLLLRMGTACCLIG
jgi:hypothetical protein